MKVFLYFIGKPRDPHANKIAEDFVGRIAHSVTMQMTEIRPDRVDLWARHPHAVKILLDPAGKQFNSDGFTKLVGDAEFRAQDLVFVVGGADGLPLEWKPRANLLLSLSAMTFPHELARAMLTEQIYRAFATLRGHPYPR